MQQSTIIQQQNTTSSSNTTSPISSSDNTQTIQTPNGIPAGSQQQPTTGGVGGGASPATPGATGIATTFNISKSQSHINGGRFDFDDGGTYCGGWEDGKAHGHGVCTGPKGQGAYSGSWHYGFEVSGIYTWPSGSAFEGQWQNGKRHGLGIETRGRWMYRGEWTQGFKGRYGVRQSSTSNAKYEGTWANGLQDGYGSETYADGGTYQGQWLRGMRHGFGVRASAPFGMASHYRPNKAIRASLTSLRSVNDTTGGGGGAPPAADHHASERRDRRIDDGRGGFVLKARSDEQPQRRNSLVEKTKRGLLSKIRKQKSTGDLEKRGISGATTGSIRSTGSTTSYMSNESTQSALTNASFHTDSNASFVIEDEHMDANVTETYMGEWKNDKRTGVGISERSDGLRYEGEWFANKKYGYGVTTFRDGSKEEGKYKNNILITSQKKKHLFLIRSAKFRERIDAAVNAAQRASKIALQKADIAISRTATARGKAELADIAADHAKEESDIAQLTAKQFAPDFKQPTGIERLRQQRNAAAAAANLGGVGADIKKYVPPPEDALPGKSILSSANKQQSIQSQQSIQQSSPPTIQQQQQQQSQQYNLMNNYNSSGGISGGVGVGGGGVNMGQQQPYNTEMQQQYNNIPSTNDYNQYNKNEQFQQNIMNGGGGIGIGTGGVVSSNSGSGGYSGSGGGVSGSTINNMTQSQSQMASSTSPSSNLDRRRMSREPTIKSNLDGIHSQSSIDRFDHYNRPSSVSRSRDSSVDRMNLPLRPGSRQTSIDKQVLGGGALGERRSSKTPSLIRGGTPVNNISSSTSNGIIKTGLGLGGAAIGINQQQLASSPPPIDMSTSITTTSSSSNQPKRTESLYITPGLKQSIGVGGGGGGGKSIPVTTTTLQRKKSLPDVQQLPRATTQMSREEVSALGSARREEVRRQIQESERLRANPLLYLVSPQVKDWFSRQQLMLLVLFVNISLAIMFFKLLT